MEFPVSVDTVIYPEGASVAIIDGKAIPVGTAPVSAAVLMEQLKEVAGLPYVGNDIEKQGMTLMEAAMYSAAKKASEGDLDAMDRILNRIMGKPIQQVQNLNMNTSLREFLDGISRSDAEPQGDTNPFSD